MHLSPARILNFIRREAVLCCAALAALASTLFVPPSAAYISYFDFRVLCLLFCLMAVVAGLRGCGLFEALALRLLRGKKTLRFLALMLVLLPFFSSMLVTNDVALLTFVPFAILILNMADASAYAPYIIVLQTVAANLGSMATPVGNPQNLFLYNRFALSPADFFRTMLPLAAASLALLCMGETSKEKKAGISDEILRIQLKKGLSGISLQGSDNTRSFPMQVQAARNTYMQPIRSPPELLY